MNYQPFYHMHILVSDELLAAISANKPALILFALLVVFCIYLFSTFINSLVAWRRIKNKRPYTLDHL